jgi:hypothetical protein
MPLYRVKPGKTVNQTGRDYTEHDDPIEVPVHVAYQLRGSLEPVDKDGELPPPPQTNVRQGPAMQDDLRDHERITVLELQLATLDKQRSFVEMQLNDVRGKIEERASGAKKKAETPKSEAKGESPKETAKK